MNGLQLFLLLITLVAVCVTGFWGFKRFKRLRYGRIKTKLRYRSGDTSDVEEDFRSELPSGGARLVEIRDPDDIETVNNRIREQAEANRPKLSASMRSPSQQATLDLGLEDGSNDPHIPVLLDPADEHTDHELPEETSDEIPSIPEMNLESEPEAEAEQLFEPESAPEPEETPEPESSDFELSEPAEPEPTPEPVQEKPDHSILFSDPETTEKHPFSRDKKESKPESVIGTVAAQKPLASEEPLTDEEPSVYQEPSAHKEEEPSSEEPSANQEQEPSAHLEKEQPSMDEVIIINLMATAEGEEFRGKELCMALEAQGLKHGAMDIFHFDSGSGSETIRFSAANVLNPGTFPAEKLEYFYTPGICFFMTMTPGVSNLQAFNKLLSAARGVASKLGGELQDQQRNYLTHQSIESIRTQMGEFQRKNLQA